VKKLSKYWRTMVILMLIQSDKFTKMYAVSLVLSCGKVAVVEEESLSGLTTLKLCGPKQRHLEMLQ
jgi:hypothetical protein